MPLLAETARPSDPPRPEIPVPDSPAAEMAPALVEMLLAETARRVTLVAALKPHLEPAAQANLAGPLAAVRDTAAKLVEKAKLPDVAAHAIVRVSRATARAVNDLEDALWTEIFRAVGGGLR